MTGSGGTAGGTETASGGNGGQPATGGAIGTEGGTSGQGGSTSGSGGSSPGSGGITGTGGETTGLKSGPFKIIVLSTTLDFMHPSIPTCLAMLKDLGKSSAPERATIAGLAPDSTWTVDEIGADPKQANYFSEVTADNLKNYELFYSNNPTGPVFTQAPNGAQKKQVFVDFWNNGGSWAGQHSATDFEHANGGTSWVWFHDNIDGAYFVDHDPPTTTGTIAWQPSFVTHPILKGLTQPWSASDEWYVMNRNVEAISGFQVIAKVTANNSSFGTSARPAVWIRENPNGNGARSFYTIRGHEPKVYAESQFRQLMLRGILWSVHRLPGGD